MSVSLVLVDPHEASREGLALLLSRAGWHVAGRAPTALDGAALAERLHPDVTLIDVDSERPAAIGLARSLRVSGASRAVVLHAGDEGAAGLGSPAAIGAHAIAMKSGGLADLLGVLSAVLPDAALLGMSRGPSPLATGLPARLTLLSRRESEIMELLSQGLTGEQVAQRLVLSIQTVKTHIRNAMLKLEASTRVHAIAIAIRRGYITGAGALAPPPELGTLAGVAAGHASFAA